MDFLITGLPRSGTAWASVWLMDGALCLHDPFSHMTPEQVLTYDPGRIWGAACTATWMMPKFMKKLQCPYVLLDKNIEQVQRSLAELGLPKLPSERIAQFDMLAGPRFDTEDLFDIDSAQEIWNILRPDRPMDVERWKLLCELKIQTDFYKWVPDVNIMRNIMLRLQTQEV